MMHSTACLAIRVSDSSKPKLIIDIIICSYILHLFLMIYSPEHPVREKAVRGGPLSR